MPKSTPAKPAPVYPVNPGDKAPAFSLPDASGALVRLADLKGKPVALFFYPKDDTTGCTQEARDFTAAAPDFAAADTVVIGVSKDSPASHARFQAKHDLAVRLLSDMAGQACEAYGVWVEKSMYGKAFMGIERSTFLIDSAGTVAQTWRKVKVAGHAQAVLQAAKSLRKDR